MAEILTESFCERCGSRYTFETRAGRRRGLGRIRTLSRGVKNFVANDDASFSDAMALAREEDARKASLQQLDAFHGTFNFCMTCRQYTCRNCWNGVAGECLSCAPDLSLEVLPSTFPDLAPAGRGIAEAPSPEAPPPNVAASAWPSSDVRVRDAIRAETAVFAEAPAADVTPPLGAEPETAPVVGEVLAAETAPDDEPAPVAEADEAPGAAPTTLVEASHATLLLVSGPGLAADVDPAAEASPPPDAAQMAAAAPGLEAGPSVDTGVELTPTEIAAIEGALHRHISRFQVPAPTDAGGDEPLPSLPQEPGEIETAAKTLQTAIPTEAIEGEQPGQPEPASEARAGTGRFIERFRLRRGPRALPAPAIPVATQDDNGAITARDAVEPDPIAEPAAPEPVASAAPQPEPVEAGAPELIGAIAEPAVAPAPEPEPEPVAAAAPEPEPVDVVKQPTWRMVAPDGTAVGDAEPSPPIWPTPASVTRRSADVMPTAAWASRVATARPVESPVWAASSRDILAGGHGTAAPVGIHSCVSCGLSLSANARFCRRCGTRQG